jgi:hypothetical protein
MREEHEEMFYKHAKQHYRAMHQEFNDEFKTHRSVQTKPDSLLAKILVSIANRFIVPLHEIFDTKARNNPFSMVRRMFAFLQLALNIFIVYIVTSFLYQFIRSKYSGMRSSFEKDRDEFYSSRGFVASSPHLPKSDKVVHQQTSAFNNKDT